VFGLQENLQEEIDLQEVEFSRENFFWIEKVQKFAKDTTEFKPVSLAFLLQSRLVSRLFFYVSGRSSLLWIPQTRSFCSNSRKVSNNLSFTPPFTKSLEVVDIGIVEKRRKNLKQL
jgi:hypothetical protein